MTGTNTIDEDQIPSLPEGEPGIEAIRGQYQNLSTVDRELAVIGARPAFSVYVTCGAIALLALLWIAAAGVVEVGPDGVQSLGPGMHPVAMVFQLLGFDYLTILNGPFGKSLAWFAALCSPTFPTAGTSLSVFFVSSLMWMAMSIAMMLPSAAPMLRTYGDIADVAAQKGERVVSIVVLAAGYLSVWMMFSFLAAGFQMILIHFFGQDDVMRPLVGGIGGLLLVGAGLYQFSSLKNACLEKCRNPFSILFGRWSTQPTEVFRLGMQQGLFCLGCCWALMLTMLAVGMMNLTFMVFLTLFTVMEKSGAGTRISRGFGLAVLAWGAILLFLSIQ